MEKWFKRDAIPMKYFVTRMEIASMVFNRENDKHNDSSLDQDSPPHELLHHYITRYELTHQDYYPLDVERIRWLTEQTSTIQFLSLEHTGNDSLSPSLAIFNDTIHLLKTLKHAIRYGYRTFGDRELKSVSLLIQMKWMDNFRTPLEIMHHCFVISEFLHDIQRIIPQEDYRANREWLDKWFEVVHSFWENLLKEVNKHLFFRTFRRTEDIPRFQHSVRWTMFFYLFQSDGDSREIAALKGIILNNSVFRNGIRDFIITVETALDDIKPVPFSAMNLTDSDLLNDAQTVVGMTLVFDAMDRDDSYQKWWSELFIDSCDHWRGTLLDIRDGNLEGYPRKEILAASILWDIEAMVAYIEPILFAKRHLHEMLLSLRKRIRRHTFQLILKESWF